jgi:hypothetical protein
MQPPLVGQRISFNTPASAGTILYLLTFGHGSIFPENRQKLFTIYKILVFQKKIDPASDGSFPSTAPVLICNGACCGCNWLRSEHRNCNLHEDSLSRKVKNAKV